MEVANTPPTLRLNGSGGSSEEEQAMMFTFRVILEGSKRSCDPLDDVSVRVTLCDQALVLFKVGRRS